MIPINYKKKHYTDIEVVKGKLLQLSYAFSVTQIQDSVCKVAYMH